MGVKDLWKLLEPAGRPVNMESLAGAVLAIDVSIWLNQAVKGMRDRHGNPLSQAHLIVLFSRVCKLLHYKIKPVFVFDGATPALKKQTLTERSRRRVKATNRSLRATDKQVTKYLQSKILEQVYGQTGNPASQTVNPTPQSAVGPTDMYELPPLPDDAVAKSPEPASPVGIHGTGYTHQMTSVDIHSEDFNSLPPEVQHELLLERQQMETHTHHDPATLPQMASDFSNYQLSKLMTQSRTTRKLEEVRKVLKSNETALMGLNDATHIREVETSRILSSEDAHYILVRGREIDSQSSQSEDEGEGGWKEGVVKWDGESKEREKDQNGGNKEREDEWNEGKEDMKDEGSDQSESSEQDESGAFKDGSKEESDVARDLTLLPVQSDTAVNSNLVDELLQEITGEIAEEITQELIKVESGSANTNIQTTLQGVAETVLHPTSPKQEPEQSLPTPEEQGHEDNTIQSTLNRKSRHSKSRAITAAVLQSSLAQAMQPSAADTSHQNLTQKTKTITSDQTTSLPHSQPQEPSDSSSSEEDEWREVLTLSPSKAQERLQEEVREWERERGRQSRAAAAVSNQMYKEAQELLQLFGLPHLVAPSEAEAQCAYLETSGQVQGTITDDNDVLLFGGKCVYRSFFSQDRDPEVYKSSDIQDRLGLSHVQLVVLAYLLGCDYTAGLEGVGVVSAMEILRDFPGDGLEPLNKLRDWHREALTKPAVAKQANRVLKKLVKSPLPPKFPDEAVYQAYLSPEVDCSSEDFEWGRPDLDLLRQFAHDKMSWDQSKVDSLLLPLLKRMNSEHKPITHYLSRPVAAQESQAQGKRIKSRRVRNVVARLTDKGESTGRKRALSSSPHKPSKQPRLSQEAQTELTTISASSSDSD